MSYDVKHRSPFTALNMHSMATNQCAVSEAPDGRSHPIPTQQEIDASFEATAIEATRHRQRGRRVVVVQGLGYVGSVVATVIANAKDHSGEPLYYVVGVDLATPDAYWKVATLNEGRPPIASSAAELPELVRNAVCEQKNLTATASEKAYSLGDVVVIDVPLDVTDRFADTPDEIRIGSDAFANAVRTVGRFMASDALVLVETTVPFGFCERVVLPLLQEERSRRSLEEPVFLANAYERVMPGPNYVDSIRRYWRSFAGIDERSTEKARDFLSSFIDTESYPLWQMEDVTSCELAKLLENSYRAMNIAFIFEWTLLAEKAGINLFETIDSIRVRKGTHDNMRYPGFGVGGYCLTKDSLLAQWSSTNLFSADTTLDLSLSALRTNSKMPLHTFELVKEAAEGDLEGKNITICGVSYLPDVLDTRNSPTEVLLDELVKAGSNVTVHDPHVLSWRERPDVVVRTELSESLRGADGVVFAVAHEAYCSLPTEELLRSVNKQAFIVDSQNIISDDKASVLHESGCQLLGVGKGHWRKRGFHCPE